MNYVLYYKIPYYNGTLIYDSVYGHSVSTHGLFLSFCLTTLCTYSLTVYSGLITFLYINLIWFIYCIIITNYYYMYCCSDSFCTVYVVIYWQVLHPLCWITGILNKWLWLCCVCVFCVRESVNVSDGDISIVEPVVLFSWHKVWLYGNKWEPVNIYLLVSYYQQQQQNCDMWITLVPLCMGSWNKV